MAVLLKFCVLLFVFPNAFILAQTEDIEVSKQFSICFLRLTRSISFITSRKFISLERLEFWRQLIECCKLCYVVFYTYAVSAIKHFSQIIGNLDFFILIYLNIDSISTAIFRINRVLD